MFLLTGAIAAIATLVLALLVAAVQGWRGFADSLAQALNLRRAPLAAAGIACALLASASLPWLPTAGQFQWVSAWLFLEIASWLPLLPALASGRGQLAITAAREGQAGALGRALLWFGLASALLIGERMTPLALASQLLAVAAAWCAMPLALGWPPYQASPSLTLVRGPAERAAQLVRDCTVLVAIGMALAPRGLPYAWLAPSLAILVALASTALAARRAPYLAYRPSNELLRGMPALATLLGTLAICGLAWLTWWG